MSVQEPLMYAELLANIRQISVVISLETPCGSETAVDLSSQRDCITIRHDGQTSVLPLPGQVAAGTVLQKPALGNKDISWRLPLAGELTRGDLDTNESPWAANILGRDTELFCRSCDETVVKKGSIKIWKDLPSENWAEMMDFWHCHKPTEHENQAMHSHSGDITANKGYGANSKFTAQSDVGFVNLTTFLLEAQDCQNVKVSFTRNFLNFHLSWEMLSGSKWVSRRWPSPAIATQWHGHRYKHPILTPCPSASAAVSYHYPFLLIVGSIANRGFILGIHSVSS